MSLDIRIRTNPLRDWKREPFFEKDDETKIMFKLKKRYRLSYKGETKLVCDTLKEINKYLKENVKR